MAHYDDLNVSRIALVGVISVIVTAVTALAVQVLFYAMAERTDSAKAASAEYRRQHQFLNAQRMQISDYGVDPDTGQVTIPIEQAIELLVSESEQASNEPKQNTDDI